EPAPKRTAKNRIHSISGLSRGSIRMQSRRASLSGADMKSSPTGASCRGGSMRTHPVTSCVCCPRGHKFRRCCWADPKMSDPGD
ncbi:MAG: hypothetical protein ACLGHS_09170, partial [Actinomycetes bacterium]